jgi:hypothetical protein
LIGRSARQRSLFFLSVKDEGETAIEIAIEGLSGLTMPRQFDWGSSVSVLDAYSTDIPSGSRLSIQMQSGDLIEVEGAHLHLPVGLMLPNTPTP